ncbi:MAG: amidohydrolase family protein [bacterium]
MIDVHVHVLALDEKTSGCFVSRRIRRHPLLRLILGMRGWEGLTDAEIDRRYIAALTCDVRCGEGVDAAVILALDAVHDHRGRPDLRRTHYHVSNGYVLRAARSNDRFLPGVSVHPARPDALDELEVCAAGGAVLVKWLPGAQLIDPADPRFDPFYEKLRELSLPLLSHTGYEHAIPAPRQRFNHPARLRRPLELGVTVIAAHSGASGFGRPVEFLPAFLSLIEKFPNLYGDLSAFTSVSRAHYLRGILADPHVAARLVNGSDYPVPPMPWLFPLRLKPARVISLQREKNLFTRDYLMKRALGVPDHVFRRAADLLRLHR